MLKTPKEQWDEVSERVAQVTDGLGLPIDEGIRETVIALNVLGIKTRASCEGHLDHGIAAPWVDIAAPDARKLEKLAHQKQRAVEDARAAGLSADERHLLMDEARAARFEAHRANVTERAKLVPHLHNFYLKRIVAYDRRLVLVSDWVGGVRLQSQGADCQEALGPEVRALLLQEYQQEMQDFTRFLKREFLGED